MHSFDYETVVKILFVFENFISISIYNILDVYYLKFIKKKYTTIKKVITQESKGNYYYYGKSNLPQVTKLTHQFHIMRNIKHVKYK